MKLLFKLAVVVSLAGSAFGQVLVPPVTAECATSVDGSVVGTLNPLQSPQVSPAFSGTLGSGNYFEEITWYDAAGHVTLPSPEVNTQLVSTGQLQVSPPSNGLPATAVGMKVYISTVSGAETLQGTTIGSATFIQSVPLANGAAPPTVNNTVCQVIANDAGWPTGTGYSVSMTDSSGGTVPGYPMQWQLLGPGGTINLGNGLPLYNGTVTYPIPILSRPYGHGPQSISGPLSIGLYPFAAGPGSLSSLSLNGSQPVNGLEGSLGLKLATASGTWTPNHLLTANSSLDIVDTGTALSDIAFLDTTNVFTQAQTAPIFNVSVFGAFEVNGMVGGSVAIPWCLTGNGTSSEYENCVNLFTRTGQKSDLAFQIVSFPTTLSGGTSVVTLSGAAVFPVTPSCWGNDTTAGNAVGVTPTSGSGLTVHGTGTDSITVFCMTPSGIF